MIFLLFLIGKQFCINLIMLMFFCSYFDDIVADHEVKKWKKRVDQINKSKLNSIVT